MIGRYCNSFSLVPIVSKSTSLYIKFKSDVNLAGRGFKGRYETRKIVSKLLDRFKAQLITIYEKCVTRNCGVRAESSKVLISPILIRTAGIALGLLRLHLEIESI